MQALGKNAEFYHNKINYGLNAILRESRNRSLFLMNELIYAIMLLFTAIYHKTREKL